MKKIHFTFILAFLSLKSHASAKPPHVAIFGDSLSASLGIGVGDQLDKKFRAAGFKSDLQAACGARPSSFFAFSAEEKSFHTRCGYLSRSFNGTQEYLNFKQAKAKPKKVPKFQDLIKNYPQDPDLVIFQLGTNLYGPLLTGSTQTVKSEIKNTLRIYFEKFPKSKCLWAAPPKISKYDGKTINKQDQEKMLHTIELAIKEFAQPSRCEVLDGTLYTKAPDAGDGTHFASKNEAWVNAIFQKSKIMLEKDASATGTVPSKMQDFNNHLQN